ncbi:MAG: hypothetical protein ACRYGK_00485 [Janthinobacterium lividum]
MRASDMMKLVMIEENSYMTLAEIRDAIRVKFNQEVALKMLRNIMLSTHYHHGNVFKTVNGNEHRYFLAREDQKTRRKPLTDYPVVKVVKYVGKPLIGTPLSAFERMVVGL